MQITVSLGHYQKLLNILIKEWGDGFCHVQFYFSFVSVYERLVRQGLLTIFVLQYSALNSLNISY